ncbi:hypothetical protein L218DRAFT_460789 [Marasmius fiardii PR-910]|nr:hypothetical protein L218DRAFT_460789 [Marasmius fiardii PR-910]
MTSTTTPAHTQSTDAPPSARITLTQSTLGESSPGPTYNLGHHGAYAVTLTPIERDPTNLPAGVPLLTSKIPELRSIYPSRNAPRIMSASSLNPTKEPAIKRLPDAILSYIFILAQYREEPLDFEFTYSDPFHYLAFPWVLMRVCVKFADVAKTTKDLWRKIRISTEHEAFAERLELNGRSFRQWMVFAIVGQNKHVSGDEFDLASAPGMGLDVHLRTSSSGFTNVDYRILSTLLEYSRSLRRFRLETHRPALPIIHMQQAHASSLEILDISLFLVPAGDVFHQVEAVRTGFDAIAASNRPPPLLFLSAPNLRTLRMTESICALREFGLPWGLLDSIQITDCGSGSGGNEWIATFLSLLPYATAVKTLQMEVKRSAPTDEAARALGLSPITRNNSVEVFEYCCTQDGVAHAQSQAPGTMAIHPFDRLMLPGLRELVLKDDSHPRSFEAAGELISRSGAQDFVMRLTIFGDLSRQGMCQQLYGLLDLVNSAVEYLTVGVNPLEGYLAFLVLEIINWFSFPRLKELTIVVRGSPVVSYLANSSTVHRAACIRNILKIIENRWALPASMVGGGGQVRRRDGPEQERVYFTPISKAKIVFSTEDIEMPEILAAVLQDFNRENAQVEIEALGVEGPSRFTVDSGDDAYWSGLVGFFPPNPPILV